MSASIDEQPDTHHMGRCMDHLIVVLCCSMTWFVCVAVLCVLLSFSKSFPTHPFACTTSMPSRSDLKVGLLASCTIADVPVPSGFVNYLETLHKAIDGQLDRVKKPDTSAVKRVQTATDQLGECFYLQDEYSDRIEEAATRMAELEGQVNAVKGQVEAAVAAGNLTDVVLGEFFRLDSSIKAAAEECVEFRVLLQSQVVKQQQLEGLIDRLIEVAIHIQQGRLRIAVGKLYEKVDTWVGRYQVPKYWQGADLVTLQSVMAAKIRAKIKAAADGVVLFMDTQYAKVVEQQAMLS